MVVAYHLNGKIVSVETFDSQIVDIGNKDTIADGLQTLALRFPEKKIVWCALQMKAHLNIKAIPVLFHHDKMMLSYTPNISNYLGRRIGYVEDSPFIKINKKVSYPTWQMSSVVGVVHASLLLAIKDKINLDSDFDYYLNSVAKVCMPLGLCCYSEPNLLNNGSTYLESKTTNNFQLFRFVKQHFKARWTFLMFLNVLVFEKRIVLSPFLYSLFFVNRKSKKINLSTIEVQSSNKVVDKGTVDVIIPTIGRKDYLYEVLRDLAQQTHLPINVIIVEQNPNQESLSELDFLSSESWPFVIKHTFTHQTGACNARNIALSKVESEWVFLADDDIRINNNLISDALIRITNYGINAVSINCFHEHENRIDLNVFQWESFGSGCSFVLSDSLKKCRFNIGFEFGYGEDSDFGMQLRNSGIDVMYFPEPNILHLSAPMGGFRIKPKLAWDLDKIQPKPSPTIMLYRLKHNIHEQLLGYKTILFFKYYQNQKLKNPIQYYKMFKKQWCQSVFWADILKRVS